jgi:hypothetical protein
MRSATWTSVPATVDAHEDGAAVVVVEAALEAVAETDSADPAAVAAALPVALDEPHAARPVARIALAHAASCRPGLVRRERLIGRS